MTDSAAASGAKEIDVVLVGAGPIGLGVLRALLDAPGLAVTAVVDVDPAKLGKDACVLAGLAPRGLCVQAEVPPAQKGAVAVLCTTSILAAFVEPVLDVIRRGYHVVSTCEELVYPWRTQPERARAIDHAARAAGVAVLGAGVNPGFVMDALPAFLTGVCRSVERVRVERVQDAAPRRRPFQDKVGVDLDLAAAKEKARAGVLRHVGLTESVDLIAAALGFTLDAVDTQLELIRASEDITRTTPDGPRTVAAGQVCGVVQHAVGRRGTTTPVELYFRATFGEERSFDRVEVHGEPRLDVMVAGGVPGDVATCAIIRNAVPAIERAQPGLRSMLDVPMVTCRW